MIATDFRELRVYQAAFQLALKVHEITKSFPKEERYSLTDQMRRSSRSVCHNIAESWRKRPFVSIIGETASATNLVYNTPKESRRCHTSNRSRSTTKDH